MSDVSQGLTQNIFLYGPQGGGKTTIARILIDGYDTLKLNGSSDNGIDVIRNQVVSFASSISLNSGLEKVKVIFIDEADGLTENAWDALRETIEHYSANVRYICTCNKIDKIPAPIRSRFNCIPVYPINKEEEQYVFQGYCNYVAGIFQSSTINITYDVDTLAQFVRNYFPDMRSILNAIQKLYTQGIHELDKNSLVKTFDCSDLFDLIVNGCNPEDNYKFMVSNYSSNPDDAMLEISKSFVEFIRMSYPQFNYKIPLLIITIAEYMAQLSTAPDRLLVLLACCFKLQIIIHQNT
jgi:replication factor C subunit 3/5